MNDAFQCKIVPKFARWIKYKVVTEKEVSLAYLFTVFPIASIFSNIHIHMSTYICIMKVLWMQNKNMDRKWDDQAEV